MQGVVMNRDQLARQLVDAAYLEGDFLLASGRRSRYYFDKYRFETRPVVVRATVTHVPPLPTFCSASFTLAIGVPSALLATPLKTASSP